MDSSIGFLRVARVALIGALALSVLAQPANDNCSSATPLSGFGIFGFDNTGASTDGIPDALCNFFGSDDVSNDVWYCWTAAGAAPVGVRTCTFTGLDSKIAVYDGCTCPAGNAILACNDDSCGLQSVATWSAAAGQTYLIRVGSYDPNDFSTGSIEVFENVIATLAGPINNPANGHDYLLLEASSWTAAEATAIVRGGHLATVNDAAENEFLRANVLGFDTADRRGWIGLNDVANEGTFVWTSGEPVNYTNWNGGEPNNSGGLEDVVEMFGSNGQWNDNRDAPPGLLVFGLVELEGETECPGDFDESGSIGLGDLTLLLSQFGTPSGATIGDLDGDGDVDLSDLTSFLSLFGTTCP